MCIHEYLRTHDREDLPAWLARHRLGDCFDRDAFFGSHVGTTRVATYLGITCDGSLPTALEPLRSTIAEHWMPA